MTEEEWLTSGQVESLLNSFPSSRSRRKLRLFAVACCRRAWHKMPKEATRRAVECAELFADGELPKRELAGARQAALRFVKDSSSTPAAFMAAAVAESDFEFRPLYVAGLGRSLRARPTQSEAAEEAAQANLIRDIYGPYLPVAISPLWRTDTAMSLARTMYESREFSAMPILADALQDAGCDNPDVLTHCRDTSLTHVRGCWVIDLVLNKS